LIGNTKRSDFYTFVINIISQFFWYVYWYQNFGFLEFWLLWSHIAPYLPSLSRIVWKVKTSLLVTRLLSSNFLCIKIEWPKSNYICPNAKSQEQQLNWVLAKEDNFRQLKILMRYFCKFKLKFSIEWDFLKCPPPKKKDEINFLTTSEELSKATHFDHSALQVDFTSDLSSINDICICILVVRKYCWHHFKRSK